MFSFGASTQGAGAKVGRQPSLSGHSVVGDFRPSVITKSHEMTDLVTTARIQDEVTVESTDVLRSPVSLFTFHL